MCCAEAVMHGSYQEWHISLHVPDDGVLLPPMLLFQDFWVKEAGRINTEQSVRIHSKVFRTSPGIYFMCFRCHFKLASFPTQCLCNM